MRQTYDAAETTSRASLAAILTIPELHFAIDASYYVRRCLHVWYIDGSITSSVATGTTIPKDRYVIIHYVVIEGLTPCPTFTIMLLCTSKRRLQLLRLP